AVAWSYDLLPAAERRLFNRLAVFAGGWTLDAAEAVVGDPPGEQDDGHDDGHDDGQVNGPGQVDPGSGQHRGLGQDRAEGQRPGQGQRGLGSPPIAPDDVLDLLAQLVDKSLVVVEELDGGAEVRYRLLETLQEYGRERLADGDGEEGAAVRQRHAAHYLALAETAVPRLTGPTQAGWLNRLETEHDNLRAALRWSVQHGAATLGLRLGVALWRFWYVRCYFTEGREWIAQLLALGAPGEAGGVEDPWDAQMEGTNRVRAQALSAAGFLAWGQGDYSAALTFQETARAELAALGDGQGVATALLGLGQVARAQGDDRQAGTLYEESLARYRAVESSLGVATALLYLGHVDSDQGKYETARRHYGESLAIFQQLGDSFGTANAMMYLGLQGYHQGSYDIAQAAYESSLSIWRELGGRRQIAELLRLLGDVAYQQGDLRVATTFLEDSLALRREIGDRFGIGECLLSLGDTAFRQGDYAGAGALFRESLALYRSLGSKRLMAVGLIKVSGVAAVEGHVARAARLLATAETVFAALGAVLWPADRVSFDDAAATARAGLTPAAWERAWAEGRAMSLPEAVLYALSHEDTER
ncbi:MAG: tetratricopeptide repeat protein, partial [Chloroflexota bacterium]|nr:tetratricopeptide repeat protein [Chloroflexota bacterium]